MFIQSKFIRWQIRSQLNKWFPTYVMPHPQDVLTGGAKKENWRNMVDIYKLAKSLKILKRDIVLSIDTNTSTIY